jgi:bifunctional non-homologous end joining protein LigD
MGLTEYKRKRNFAVTSEPSGAKKPRPKSVAGASRFVIQKHEASRLHYDFRLEMAGVLKSWAVPKGLPWIRGEKHLAVEVEDHPIDYEDFEGVIPQGNYGGGTVMVWDRGKYYVHGENPLEALKEGRLHMVLEGEKARGDWSLIRTRIEGAKTQWLLLKSDADLKPISKKRDDESVKTGRTMKQIAKDRDAEWQSNRGDEKKKPMQATRREVAVPKLPEKLPAGKARFVEPMKPRLVETPPTQGDWIYELKFDGFRALALKGGGKIELLSRNQNDLTQKFAEVAEALGELPGKDWVIDGEVVSLDEKGRSSFQLLQAREMEAAKSPLYYYIFDLLELDGKDLTALPLTTRKEVLRQLSEKVGDPIRFSGGLGDDPQELLKQVKRIGLEGIVGKQSDSKYEPGRRSGAWIKLKCVNEQEFVIGGYTPPAGARKHFGALLVGYYEEKKLLFAGKVGTGFNAKLLASLHKEFQAEAREDCPFADLPSKQGGKWVQGITPAMMRKCHWVNPVFVAQVKFAEWTREAKLRQPVFLGLREDKAAQDVKREVA